MRYRVLLTGGIATGKSFVADYLTKLGATVIDTDQIAREVVDHRSKRGTALLNQLVELFGKNLLLESGALNRKALREVIFNSDRARERVEELMHPAIFDATVEALERCDGGDYQVVALPLIDEDSPYLQLADHILVVEVYEEIQKQRLMSRDSIDEALAEQMMRAQISRLARRKFADTIIINRHKEITMRVLERLHLRYKQGKRE